MELRVERRWKLSDYTIGNLFIDGEYFCDTLEDKDRGLRQDMPEMVILQRKIHGVTAIPAGRYRVSMDITSTTFQFRTWAKPYGGKVPALLSVPGYSGVLIHVGNTPSDTSGCILVGFNNVKGQVTDSTNTFYKLMDKHLLPAKRRGEEIWITIG